VCGISSNAEERERIIANFPPFFAVKEAAVVLYFAASPYPLKVSMKDWLKG